MAAAVASFVSAGGEVISAGQFSLSRLSPVLYKVVETDPYGQIPMAFVIVGADKVVVVDTGTGAGGSSLKSVLDRHINAAGLPYVVLCTHNHYDHVGGAAAFKGSKICMGGKNKTYSMNLEITSLAGGVGARVAPFEVTDWLDDGAEVFLDESDRSEWNRLRILHIPGHAIDHIAVYFERERRLFVGDTLYPFTAIDLANMGSSLPDYRATLERIAALADAAEATPIPEAPASPTAGTEPAEAAPGSPAEAGAPGGGSAETAEDAAAVEARAAAEAAVGEVEGKAAKAKELVEAWIGLSMGEAAEQFDPWTLLEASGWDVAAAASTCQELGEAIADAAPPGTYALPKTAAEVRRQFGLSEAPPAAKPAPAAAAGGSARLARDLPAPSAPASRCLTLACGHVDPALDARAAVGEAQAMLEAIVSGALPPTSVDSEYGSAEYRGSTLSFVLPHPLPAPKTA